MKRLPLMPVLLGIVGFIGCRAAEVPTPPEHSKEDMEKLIANLSSEEFTERDASEMKLRDMGESAIPLLREMIKDAKDTEASQRIGRLLELWPSPYVPLKIMEDRRMLIDREKVHGIVEELYGKYVAEWKRVIGLSGNYERVGYVGESPLPWTSWKRI
ncbi:MAG: hypothetical protein KIS92_17410 [Planctomycetota bacterium]|nr:hypothetical protein [Planctomycetota bacterium]